MMFAKRKNAFSIKTAFSIFKFFGKIFVEFLLLSTQRILILLFEAVWHNSNNEKSTRFLETTLQKTQKDCSSNSNKSLERENGKIMNREFYSKWLWITSIFSDLRKLIVKIIFKYLKFCFCAFEINLAKLICKIGFSVVIVFVLIWNCVALKKIGNMEQNIFKPFTCALQISSCLISVLKS